MFRLAIRCTWRCAVTSDNPFIGHENGWQLGMTGSPENPDTPLALPD
jgi:hypothetical protein